MALTAAQLSTLKADILANSGPGGDFENIPNTPDGNFAIADAYNLVASPNWWVWRTSLDKHEVYGQTGIDTDGVTVTQWNWVLFAGLNPGEQGAWVEMFNETGIQNPSLVQVRAGWADIFAGPQAGPTAQRAHISAISRRLALRIEKLFASGTGTAADPGLLDYQGTITYIDVENARNLP